MSAPPVYFTGMREVLGNINKVLAGMDRSSASAMHKAVLMVRRDAARLTPVRNGDLIRSQYGEVYRDAQGGYSGVIGYTMSYAPYVHEINKRYRKPGSQWKYLETALKNNASKIVRLFGSELDVTKQINAQRQQAAKSEVPLADFGEEFGFVG